MTVSEARLDQARTVADAVLYEGYLLYPYRASSDKNRSRWQFGVLGPPGAADRGLGEPEAMTMHTVLTGATAESSLLVRLRFLQLQCRQVLDADGVEVERLVLPDRTELTWEEAVEQELALTVPVAAGDYPVEVGGAELVEPLAPSAGGAVVRRRWPLRAEVSVDAARHGDFTALSVRVRNDHDRRPATRKEATRTSLLGAHLLVEAEGCAFVSMVDPPADARSLVDGFRQDRCWPVLCGEPSEPGAPGRSDLLLGSPIILDDFPQIAPQSAGALFDATEIDEILTLRVITMTDAEKAEARATDPRAAAIIDRCDAMTPGDLQQLHGVLRDPHTRTDPDDTPWWDPAADSCVDPDKDSVLVDGVRVRRGSLVRVHPSRRADAQDLFFADQVARVTSVLSDVDGGTHVALVLVDDPAADLHDWYGRYFYFAPDELEPLDAARKES